MAATRTIRGLGGGLLLLALATGGQAQDFEYLDFNSTAGLTLVGNALATGGVLRVTPAAGNQLGATYYTTPVRVGQGFDTRFRFQMGSLGGGGADGLAFVVHADPRGTAALGSAGGELGYGAGATAPAGTAIANSLVVELDTYFSGTEGDLSANTVSVHTNGPFDNDNDELYSLGQVTPPQNLSDGLVHELRVRLGGGTLEVYLDDLNNPLLTMTYDVATGGPWYQGGAAAGLSLPPGDVAWVGFTAATGGAWETHDVLSWRWSSNGGPGTAFCSGDPASAVCPCGNAGATGEGCANSLGAGAALGSLGSPAVSAGDFALVGNQLPPGRPCLFVQADAALNNGAGFLWGDGLRCVTTNVVPLGVVWSDAAGSVAGPPAIVAAGAVGAGQTKVYQLWYRDPLGPCSSGYNATNGLSVSFTP